jgi:hypothetical protein
MTNTLPPARLRNPELHQAVVDACRFPALQHRIGRELLANPNITANSIREITTAHLRSQQLSQAKMRQQQLILKWKQSHPEVMASLEASNRNINVSVETQAQIQQEAMAEQVLLSAPLGALLDPRHNLGQRRRSHRTQNQVSVEEQHRLLTQRIADLHGKK